MKCKRLFACLAVLVLLMASLPVAALAETYARVVCFDVLHLRSGPGSDYEIIGKYRNGTKVQILSTGSRWAKVKTPDNKIGYMYTEYLSAYTKTDSNTDTSGATIRPKTMYIKSGIGPVNFRRRASINSKLLDQIPGGTAVTVLSKGATWIRVKYNGTLGWIKTKYLVSKKN